jgi:predicted flap endonuclease-1-like 5' DNA nuclease
LKPVHTRLAELDAAIKAIKMPVIPAFPVIPVAKDVDLNPVYSRIADLDKLVRAIRIPEAPPPAKIDFSLIENRLTRMESSVTNIRIPASTTVDLTGIFARFEAIEGMLRKREQSADVRAGSKNLLTRPAYGKPDDLKIIKGVATVLEKMLHGIGVYYFWQVADWDANDVTFVDTQLEIFKGRIVRDSWVTQCVQLAKQPTSAKPPKSS